MDDNNEALVLSLLVVDNNTIKNLHEVSSRDIYEQNSTVFKSDGLYSISTFGDIGSKERLSNFAYIDLNLKVLHPRIYRELVSLNSLYKSILDGSKFVIFDDKLKDFVISNEDDGHTGYTYFLKYYKDVVFNKKDIAISRGVKIEFLEKFSLKESIITKFLVLPAGLRDYTVTESGKVLENEINGLYRKLLTASSTAKVFKDDNGNDVLLNSVKNKLQKSINAIYDYIENILDGKGGYLQNKETKRAIFYGTRNVITSTPNEILDIDDEYSHKSLTSTVGIYQGLKGIYPKAIFELRSKYLHDVFDPESTKARLIDKETLKRNTYDIDEKSRSKWVTDDGLEKMFNKLQQDVNKNRPIIINDKYLFLIYKKDNEVILFTDIDMLPDGYDKKYVKPITYGELIYIVLNKIIPKYKALITRYPITGSGSIVPTNVVLDSTIETTRVNFRLGVNSEPIILDKYPIIGKDWYSSLSLDSLYLDGLSGDYDGDKVSLNFVWTEAANKELEDKMNNITFFKNAVGKLVYSSSTVVNSAIMKLITED